MPFSVSNTQKKVCLCSRIHNLNYSVYKYAPFVCEYLIITASPFCSSPALRWHWPVQQHWASLNYWDERRDETQTGKEGENRTKKESHWQRNKTWTVKISGAASIQAWYIFTGCYFVSGSPLLSLDPDIPQVHIRTGLCVISLIKGLIGGQGGANHRLVSGSRLSGGFWVRGKLWAGLLCKQEHRDWSNHFHKANSVA